MKRQRYTSEFKRSTAANFQAADDKELFATEVGISLGILRRWAKDSPKKKSNGHGHEQLKFQEARAELEAMRAVLDALEDLDSETRVRVVAAAQILLRLRQP